MGKIEILLQKLDNKVTPNIAKRLDGLKSLNSKLEVSQKEYEANADDEELKESLEEIKDYISDYEEDLIDDLESLLESKQKAQNKPQGEEAPKGEEKPKGEESPKDEDKKSSGGITALIIGGVLLVASIGAINIFKNNR
jgi:hypothetical protein